MLSAKLKQVIKDRDLTVRQVALETGVSHTTIVRAIRGDIVDVGTILKLSEWLGVKPNTLLNSMATTKDTFAEQIAVMLEGNPSLTAEFKKAVQAILENKVDASIIEDIALYAAYKINIKSHHG